MARAAPGSRLRPKGAPARKRWIASAALRCSASSPSMRRRQALARGSSLLPAGVRAVTGDFSRGDPLSVRDEADTKWHAGFRPMTPNPRASLPAIAARNLQRLLGWRGRDEIIHRDDLVLL